MELSVLVQYRMLGDGIVSISCPRRLFCPREGYFALEKVMLPSRRLFCPREGYFALEKVILPSRRLFCPREGYFALEKVILPSRRLFLRRIYLSFCQC